MVRSHGEADATDVVLAGFAGDEATARAGLRAPDARQRRAALGALRRLGALTDADLADGAHDADAGVRRRAAVLAPPGVALTLLDDPEPLVAEAAAWALGEAGEAAVAVGAVVRLAAIAGTHPDPLVREAAVAALGALGHDDGRAAVLAATTDRPAVRRRAVLALAAFEGPEVEAALERALADRDWQVRQAAEDLRAAGAGSADRQG
jgi:HEAT repeat protein